MSGPVLFSDLDNPSSFNNKKPFFAINHANEDEVFTWLKEELAFLQTDSSERLEKIKNNYLRYKGIQYLQQIYVPRDTPEVSRRYTPQMTVPLIRDGIDERVARLLEFKPSIAVIPTHDEENDKNDAKISKRFLSHIEYQEKLDQKFLTFCRDSKVAGETYVEVGWNPDKGDMLKPMEGQPVLVEGKPYNMPVFQGDVDIINRSVNNTFYQKQRKYSDVDYCFLIDPEFTEGLLREYPDKSAFIKTDNVVYFDTEKLCDEHLSGRTYKIRFYHRPTKYLPNGFEVCFTQHGILKKSDQYPYKHKKLPIVRLTDTLNPEELHGEASTEYTKSMASQYNNLTNMIVKQQMLAAHPRWFIDAGSVDEQSLGNDMTIVKVKNGAKTPVLAQGNPVSPQVFEFRKELKQEFYQMSKSNSVVQGEPPTGVTAFVALQYVSESESRRMSTDVQVLNIAIRETYDLTLQTAAQFYVPGEERTMNILGPDANWTTKRYNPSSLQKPFAIMIQNQTALPDSRAVRTQFVLDMADKYPNIFPEDQVVEMLGLGQSEKFMDLGSAAARAAEDEQEQILSTGQQIEPAEWEDQITHWRIHVMKIQDIGFKTVTKPEARLAMLDHIRGTEMLMIDQAKKSPQYAQLLLTLPNFPLLYIDQQATAAAGMLTGVLPKIMGGSPGEMAPPPDEPGQMEGDPDTSIGKGIDAQGESQQGPQSI